MLRFYSSVTVYFRLLPIDRYPVTNTTPEHPAKKKQSPFIDLIVSILLPSVILMKLSGDDKLGPTGALILALAFPVGWGLYDLAKNGTKNYVAILGVVSLCCRSVVRLLRLELRRSF